MILHEMELELRLFGNVSRCEMLCFATIHSHTLLLLSTPFWAMQVYPQGNTSAFNRAFIKHVSHPSPSSGLLGRHVPVNPIETSQHGRIHGCTD
jgi:hypothetical protein